MERLHSLSFLRRRTGTQLPSACVLLAARRSGAYIVTCSINGAAEHFLRNVRGTLLSSAARSSRFAA